MIVLLSFLIRFIGFLVATSLVPGVLGWAIAGKTGLAIGIALVWVILFLDSFRVPRILTQALKPTPVLLYGKKVYRIEDASSHLFVTQGPWTPARVWITRGAFSLLTQAELHTLVLQARKAQPFFKLSFESYLTTLLIRLEKLLPHSLIALGYSHLETRHPVRIREVLWGLPIWGLMSLLEVFYSRSPTRVSTSPSVRTALGVLERESKVCSPQLSPALANHALIAPWPHALLRFGRSCLS